MGLHLRPLPQPLLGLQIDALASGDLIRLGVVVRQQRVEPAAPLFIQALPHLGQDGLQKIGIPLAAGFVERVGVVRQPRR